MLIIIFVILSDVSRLSHRVPAAKILRQEEQYIRILNYTNYRGQVGADDVTVGSGARGERGGFVRRDRFIVFNFGPRLELCWL